MIPLTTGCGRGAVSRTALSSETDAQSSRWREDFIRTYLERDIPQFGPRITSETFLRFWTMIGHSQGGLLNIAQSARNVGIDIRTADDTSTC